MPVRVAILTPRPLVGRCFRFLALGLELLLNHLAEVVQGLTVIIAELTRLLVHDAERPDVVPPRPSHGLRRVEADVRLFEHQWVLREPRIERSVLNDEDFGARYRVAAEREIARAVADWKPLLRFEPLALSLDE